MGQEWDEYVVDVPSIHDNEAVERRKGCTDWVDISSSDYVTAVKGFHLSRACFCVSYDSTRHGFGADHFLCVPA